MWRADAVLRCWAARAQALRWAGLLGKPLDMFGPGAMDAKVQKCLEKCKSSMDAGSGFAVAANVVRRRRCGGACDMCGRRRRRRFDSADALPGSFLVLGISSSACANRRNLVPERPGWQTVRVALCRIGSGRSCGIGARVKADEGVQAFFYDV
jgi:hypothetical protein